MWEPHGKRLGNCVGQGVRTPRTTRVKGRRHTCRLLCIALDTSGKNDSKGLALSAVGCRQLSRLFSSVLADTRPHGRKECGDKSLRHEHGEGNWTTALRVGHEGPAHTPAESGKCVGGHEVTNRSTFECDTQCHTSAPRITHRVCTPRFDV